MILVRFILLMLIDALICNCFSVCLIFLSIFYLRAEDCVLKSGYPRRIFLGSFFRVIIRLASRSIYRHFFGGGRSYVFVS